MQLPGRFKPLIAAKFPVVGTCSAWRRFPGALSTQFKIAVKVNWLPSVFWLLLSDDCHCREVLFENPPNDRAAQFKFADFILGEPP
jgi:hypothetical protein